MTAEGRVVSLIERMEVLRKKWFHRGLPRGPNQEAVDREITSVIRMLCNFQREAAELIREVSCLRLAVASKNREIEDLGRALSIASDAKKRESQAILAVWDQIGGAGEDLVMDQSRRA